MRQIGPCYTCSQWGHLARACPRNQQPYPFDHLIGGVKGMSCVCNSEPNIVNGMVCVSESNPNDCVKLYVNGAAAVHEGHGVGLKEDNKRQRWATENLKGC